LAARRLLFVAVVLIDGAAWGGLYAVAKTVIEAGGHPIGLAVYEGLGSGLLLLALCALTRRRLPLAAADARIYLASGILGIAIPAAAIFAATEHLPVGIVTLFFALVPVLTYGFALPVGLERADAQRLGGLACGLMGMLLIVLPDSSLPNPQAVGWVLIGFAACSCYAVQNLYIAKWVPARIDTLMLSSGTLLAGGAILLPVAFASGTAIAPWPPDDPIVLGALAIAAINCVAIVLFFWLIRAAGPVFAAQTASTTILAGVVFGAVFFGERLSPWVWAAIGLLAVGVLLVQPRGTVAAPAQAAEKRL
jgi:drug/metabolite transporter (DMT)-like permease